jgi:hypothetical protein
MDRRRRAVTGSVLLRSRVHGSKDVLRAVPCFLTALALLVAPLAMRLLHMEIPLERPDVVK